MIKETLSLLNDKPNIFDFPQSTIDPFRIEEEDREIFISTAKIFLSKSKSHYTSKYVKFHVENNLKFFDIIRLPKYPLPAVYNKTTKRCIINLSAIGKKSVSNINMRDIYTLIVYSHICSTLSSGITISEENADPFCEYMIQMFLKSFAKTYGLTGSYVDMIPQVRLLVALYVYVSFFGIKQNAALQRASYLSKTDSKKIKLDFSKYDFMKINDLLMSLSDSQVMPGLGTYRFLDRMIKTISTINLPFFEDIMRFSSIMVSSSINGNSYFPPHLQMINQKLYLKVNSIIEEVVDKSMIR